MSNDINIIENKEVAIVKQQEISLFNEARLESEKTLEKFADAICGIDAVKKAYESKNEIRLVADLTPEMRKAIKDGTKKLDVNGDKIYAQLRDKRGKWSDKITLKELPAEIIVDPIALSTAMQMKAIEKKLDDIVDTLAAMSVDIDAVRVGQENDRIALYYSGSNLFREAERMLDPGLKALVTSQAVKCFSDASSQEMQSVKTDIQYLVEKKHLKLPKGKVMNEVQKRMNNINKCLEVIHKSNVSKAGVYYKNGEIEAMLQVFDEYGEFVKHIVQPYAGKLAELDKNEMSIDGSKWVQYVNSLDSIKEIRKQIDQNKPIYIEGDTIHA